MAVKGWLLPTPACCGSAQITFFADPPQQDETVALVTEVQPDGTQIIPQMHVNANNPPPGWGIYAMRGMRCDGDTPCWQDGLATRRDNVEGYVKIRQAPASPGHAAYVFEVCLSLTEAAAHPSLHSAKLWASDVRVE